MMNSFENLIKNNFEIIKTLFHINENNINSIDDRKRLIRKDVYISRIFDSIPILKGLLEELLKDYLLIETKIKEVFNDKTDEFIYKVKFNNPKISNYRVYLKLNRNNDIINVSINIINKNTENFNFNPTDELIFQLIINYYKDNFLEKDLKKVLSKYSYQLNIL